MKTILQTNIEAQFTERSQSIPTSFIREILAVTQRPEVISFAGGLPNAKLFPSQELKASASRVLQKHGMESLQYAMTQGDQKLREWIANRYKSHYGLDCTAEQILITNGAQQGLDLLARLFISPGDQVLMESPGYLGAIQSFSAYDCDFIPLPMEKDGPNMEDFESLINYNQIKLYYSVPNFQNPSGISYSASKRHQIANQLLGKDILLIEDDPYHELYFDESPPPPIKTYLGKQSILVGSFSKIISPGLRIGWILADELIIKQLNKLKQASDLHTSSFNQMMITDFLENNDLDAHLQTCRQFYARQRDAMLGQLKATLPPEIRFTEPSGGMFMWLQLPERLNARELLEATIKENLVFVPGDTFFTNGQGTNMLRLNYSNGTKAQLIEGVAILAKHIKKMIEAG